MSTVAGSFWSHVDKGGPPHPALGTSCWVWTRARTPPGYGKFSFKGRQHYAHRWAYGDALGPVPEGMHVLHHCDNPPCCNPAHLWIGTNADNVKDRSIKGRSARCGVPPGYHMPAHQKARGERHGLSKLTADKVRLMRDLRSKGGTWGAVASVGGVCRRVAKRAVDGETWKHVT